jgi:ATP-dependent DNA helicase RecG
MDLNNPVGSLKGIGNVLARKLKLLNITTINDLINYFPRRYDDYSVVLPIKDAKPGIVTVEAEVKSAKGRYARRGLHITEAIASDKTDSMRLIWFNQPYREASLVKGKKYFISGEFGLHGQHLSMVNPSIELASEFPVNTARIVPIYREIKGLKSSQIRTALKSAFEYINEVPEGLPSWLIKKYKLLSKKEALKAIHFPLNSDALDEARYRLGFEELFELCLAALLNKYELMKLETISIPFKQKLAKEFVANLPFTLTDEQRKTVWQIYLDMQKDQSMNRLVEGDVGTGKTVVAAMAAVMVMEQGYQVAFMAPTELLARQHAETLYKLLKPLGLSSELTLLIGSMSKAKKKVATDNLKSGVVKLAVGTHALIQEDVDMHKLALIVIDEQHRFGVKQRQTLQKKAGHMPHLLSMTATPIPRSLQLTLYGELDVSIIKNKPYTDKPIDTSIYYSAQRTRLYQSIDKQIEKGRQVFIVCPLITPTPGLAARSVEDVYVELKKGTFSHRRIGMLHGKLKAAEKEKIMEDFVSQKLDILVATTIVEVGVDVPNATVMVIENADRFGLAQIHQLRGRVGRSGNQGYCYLVIDDQVQISRRLRALESTQDGFKLAELDLKIRGPGAIYGTMQHGELDLRIAQLTDRLMIMKARQAAQEFIDKRENMLKYKELNEHVTNLRAITNLN